jgi:hypothetical protein
LAEEVGIEPTNDGIKTRCLTTWRLPKKLKKITYNLLLDSIAALRGARFLAYQFDMFRSLRAVRLALKSLATVVSDFYFTPNVATDA